MLEMFPWDWWLSCLDSTYLMTGRVRGHMGGVREGEAGKPNSRALVGFLVFVRGKLKSRTHGHRKCICVDHTSVVVLVPRSDECHVLVGGTSRVLGRWRRVVAAGDPMCHMLACIRLCGVGSGCMRGRVVMLAAGGCAGSQMIVVTT